MSGEECANKTDFFLRSIPEVKIGNNSPAPFKDPFKEQLQSLHLSEDSQEQIMETLMYIHGPDFKLKEASHYKDVKTNLGKKYWLGQNNLVIKGACDYSKNDNPTFEEDRIKEYALLRLESYGFHQSHCMEAFKYCEENVEDALYALYNKYFNNGEFKGLDFEQSEEELLEQRQDERSSLESIYDKTFHEKVHNKVWMLSLKLDYLIKIFHNCDLPKKVVVSKVKKKEKCRNFVSNRTCKFGNECRFSHEIDKIEPKNVNAHLTNYVFELEVRFPDNTKYPFEPPLILLKTDAVLPRLVNLHICKRLYQEAKALAEDGIPSVYTITELLLNEEEITTYLKTNEIYFIATNKHLFEESSDITTKPKRPSHYIKGVTNRDNKKALTKAEIAKNDEKIVDKFNTIVKEKKFLEMLQHRRTLPAWNLMKEIVNTVRTNQVVVISGETGCGKSTQVPQYLLDDWILNYRSDKKHSEIVCTQPRRISAISVAERVAQERCARIGNTVGYQIRLETKTSIFTRLTFCTTGILLRRLESEPTLPNVTHIIVDEVHERSEESDFLLLILKEVLPFRPDLKVILMSATMNADLFSDYFGGVPILTIPGRTFPVEELFLEDVFEMTDYVLEPGSEYTRKDFNLEEDENDDKGWLGIVDAVAPKPHIKDENLKFGKLVLRYKECSLRTCRNLAQMDHEVVNNELIEKVLEFIVGGEHDWPKEGTILIFLPGIAEITALYDQLGVHPVFGGRNRGYLVLPLHSSLSSEEQALIFKKPKGQRKIILSTNIAETSVTIDDCVFVIDSGRMREKHFDPNRNMESLDITWVTRANALQRKGRAGRVMPGVCFHLFTSNRYHHQFLPQPIPEIQRIPLESLILNIKLLEIFQDDRVGDVINRLIEAPSPEHVETAIMRLQDVGALDASQELTPLGHHLAVLPVDVRIGKLILYGAIFSCVNSALTMAACLSYKSPFVSPFRKKKEADEKKKQFVAGYSDQITILVAYKKWLSVYEKSFIGARNYANENFLSHKTLLTIADIKYQFLEFLVDTGFISVNLTRRKMGEDNVLKITGTEFNRNGDNLSVLSAILCAALYPNVVKVLTPPKTYVRTAGGAILKENQAKDLKFQTSKERVFIHPSSVNYSVNHFTSPYLVYQEKVKTSKVFFRDCTMIPVVSLVLFSGFELDVSVHNGCTFLALDSGWIMFHVEEHKIAEMVKMLRKELYVLLEEKIKDPLLNIWHHEHGEKVISTILNLINKQI